MFCDHDHGEEEAHPPRWLEVLQKAIEVPENKEKMAYQVATVDADGVPHVRTQIHRGIMTPKTILNVPILVSSTDIRAPKVDQIMHNDKVEIAWWMEGSKDQFRVSGRAFIIPARDHPLHQAALSKLVRRLPLVFLTQAGEEGGPEGQLDWEEKRKELFDAMRPAMRATWARPVAPGSVIESYDVPKAWSREVATSQEAKDDEEKKKLFDAAYANFAVVLIEPFKVDWVQLGEKPNRRTIFTRDEDDDTWSEEIVAP